MKPQLRLVARLHPSMLKSSTHWCFLALGNAVVASNDSILKLDSNHTAALLVRQGTVDVRIHDGDSVYPCALQQDGSIEPECWPIEKGEEEIVEWRGHSNERLEPMQVMVHWKGGSDWMWQLESKRKHRPVSGLPRIDVRSGLCPSPRKGKSGPVWVWEPINRGNNDS